MNAGCIFSLMSCNGVPPKQLDLLMKYLELSGSLGGGNVREVAKAELLRRASATPSCIHRVGGERHPGGI